MKQIEITKPIRLIELFSGYGSQYQALRRIGVNVESYKISDWNIPSNESYKAMLEVIDNKYDNTDYSLKYTQEELINIIDKMNLSIDGKNPIDKKFIKRKGKLWQKKVFNNFISTNNLGSITQFHAKDLEIIDKDKYEYIMTYSFPCLIGETKILTNNGEKNIKDIKIGDKVFTHKNTYETVIASKKTGYKNIFEVKTEYTSVICTENHKFYVRRKIGKYEFSNPEWIEAKDLDKNCYLAYIGSEYPDIIKYLPVKDYIDLNKKEDVYDIEVENAHSFVANNIIVHNCQDLSLAGKQAGMSKGSNTRSGLLWEVERLLQESIDNNLELPDILLMENVPQVCNKKNESDFNDWKSFLESIGYKNFVKILNAVDFGIPQNRKRCFMVSILTDEDIIYNFPESRPLTRCVKDILETDVDEKYYINNDKAKELIQSLLERKVINNDCDREVIDGTIKNPNKKDVSNCIKSRYDAGISNQASTGTMVISKKIDVVGKFPTGGQRGRIYNSKGIIGTLSATDYKDPSKIIEHYPIVKKESIICGMRGRPIENPNIRQAGLPTKQRLEPNEKGISNTLTTVQKDNIILENIIYDNYNEKNSFYNDSQEYRIRKLTPKECGRLMDVDDKVIDAMSKVNSNSKLYSQLGNSIVISVLCYIFKNMNINQ